MTEAEVIEVETALRVKLPAFFRNFLLNYPKDLLDFFLWRGMGTRMLYGTAAEMIEGNRHAREYLVTEPGGNPHPWRNEYFAIGNDGDDDEWCILLRGKDEAVYQYNSGDGGFAEMCPSLSARVAALRRQFLECRPE
jgi:hypothetical protein